MCLTEGVVVSTKPELVDKIEDINKLLRRTWTEQEVTEKLRRQNALLAKFSGADRDHLTKQLELALTRGDENAVHRLQERLDNLEIPRLAFRTSLHPDKKKLENRGPTQQEKLALLNAENRRRNAEAVRKAQLAERARAREIEVVEAKANGAQLGSGASTPAVGGGDGGTPKQAAGLLPHIAKLQEQQRSLAKPGMSVIHKPLTDDDIIGALDLDIDVEID